MAGSMIERVVTQSGSFKPRDTIEKNKDLLISPSHSDRGGATLVPATHFTELSTSRQSTNASASHPTELSHMERIVSKIDNVLLMGQFNYDFGPIPVQHWFGRWSEVFSHIEVRGAFSNSTLDALQEMGISAFFGGSDAGRSSPTRNVGYSLRVAERVRGIVGVMYVHDDMMVNIRALVQQGFPWESQAAFACAYTCTDKSFSVRKDGKVFSKLFNMNATGVSDALNTPPFDGWYWNEVLPGASELAKDERFSQYFDEAGTFSFSGGRMDFAYVPTRFASFFSPLAELMTEKGIFLEVAFGTVVVETAKKFNAVLVNLRLCQQTAPDVGEWVPKCFNASAAVHNEYEGGHRTTPVELFHPIKIGSRFEIWDICFDRIVLQQENLSIPLPPLPTTRK